MSIVRIDPEGRRNAEHIAIIVVVDLVPIQSHFRSRRPQAQQPLYQDAHTATGPAQTATGQRDVGHRPRPKSVPRSNPVRRLRTAVVRSSDLCHRR